MRHLEGHSYHGLPDMTAPFYHICGNPAPRAPPDPQASNAERPRRKARSRRKPTKNSSVLTYSNVFLPYSSLTYQYIRQGPFFFPPPRCPPVVASRCSVDPKWRVPRRFLVGTSAGGNVPQNVNYFCPQISPGTNSPVQALFRAESGN